MTLKDQKRSGGCSTVFLHLIIWLLLVPIRLYKAFISPLLPPTCRFHPSCSVYAMGSIGVHGPLQGSWLALRRILRCHPWNPGGFDMVPSKNGMSAVEVLSDSFPLIASKLQAPPPSYWALFHPPPSTGMPPHTAPDTTLHPKTQRRR